MSGLLEQPPLIETAYRAYITVAVSTLLPTETRGFDLHLRRGRKVEYFLFCDRVTPLTEDALLKLQHSGVLTLYVTVKHQAEYARYLNEALAGARQLPTDRRYQLLSAVAKTMLIAAFNKNDLLSAMPTIKSVAGIIVEHLATKHLVLRHLFSLMTHDYCTYAHANNVSMYCVLLARQLGNDSPVELTEIAAGGLLHDAGKRHLPGKLLNKVERLTDQEKAVIRRHPQHGFEDLCRSPDLNWGQLMMVYQHHERLDGGGYPAQIAADEIHPWAKICAVADVFDALTGARPYRHALRAAEAIAYLSKRAPVSYDPEIVACLSILMLQHS